MLDNGKYWAVEPFQLEIVELVFAGYREVLAVLPTGNYKTTTVGGLALYHCQYVQTARVPIGAASKDQAAILYEQAKGIVERSPGLDLRFKVQDGYRRIVCYATGGLIRVYSAKDDTGDGIVPTLPILDELHRQKGHDLYGTWRDKGTKRSATLVAISTAGDDENNPVEQMRDAAYKLPNVKRRGRRTIATSDGPEFAMIEYALRESDVPKDPRQTPLEVIKLANPAKQVTLEELRMRRDSPSTKGWQLRRYTFNLRSKGEDSAVDPDDWDALEEKGLQVAHRVPIYGWLDLAWKIDTTAMGILAWEGHERRVVTDVRVIEPPPKGSIDEAEVVVGLLLMQARWGHLKLENGDDAFKGIVYDENAGGQQMAQLLEKGIHPLQTDDDLRDQHGLPRLNGETLEPLVFIPHSQDNAPMSLAARRMQEAIRNGWLRHDGDPKLRAHALNAVEHGLSGEKFRYDRPADKKGRARGKYPIDAFTGLLFGHNVAVGEHDEEETPPPTDFLDYDLEFA